MSGVKGVQTRTDDLHKAAGQLADTRNGCASWQATRADPGGRAAAVAPRIWRRTVGPHPGRGRRGVQPISKIPEPLRVAIAKNPASF